MNWTPAFITEGPPSSRCTVAATPRDAPAQTPALPSLPTPQPVSAHAATPRNPTPSMPMHTPAPASPPEASSAAPSPPAAAAAPPPLPPNLPLARPAAAAPFDVYSQHLRKLAADAKRPAFSATVRRRTYASLAEAVAALTPRSAAGADTPPSSARTPSAQTPWMAGDRWTPAVDEVQQPPPRVSALKARRPGAPRPPLPPVGSAESRAAAAPRPRLRGRRRPRPALGSSSFLSLSDSSAGSSSFMSFSVGMSSTASCPAAPLPAARPPRPPPRPPRGPHLSGDGTEGCTAESRAPPMARAGADNPQLSVNSLVASAPPPLPGSLRHRYAAEPESDSSDGAPATAPAALLEAPVDTRAAPTALPAFLASRTSSCSISGGGGTAEEVTAVLTHGHLTARAAGSASDSGGDWSPRRGALFEAHALALRMLPPEPCATTPTRLTQSARTAADAGGGGAAAALARSASAPVLCDATASEPEASGTPELAPIGCTMSMLLPNESSIYSQASARRSSVSSMTTPRPVYSTQPPRRHVFNGALEPDAAAAAPWAPQPVVLPLQLGAPVGESEAAAAAPHGAVARVEAAAIAAEGGAKQDEAGSTRSASEDVRPYRAPFKV